MPTVQYKAARSRKGSKSENLNKSHCPANRQAGRQATGRKKVNPPSGSEIGQSYDLVSPDSQALEKRFPLLGGVADQAVGPRLHG